jgi:hypothetical protein
MKWVLILLLANSCDGNVHKETVGTYSSYEACMTAKKDLDSHLNMTVSICSETNHEQPISR